MPRPPEPRLTSKRSHWLGVLEEASRSERASPRLIRNRPNFAMSAPKGADITDAATRSALVLLFKQLVLATPKTRSLTITIGDIKITTPPVQHTHWQAARGSGASRQSSSRGTACPTRSSAAAPTARPRGQASRRPTRSLPWPRRSRQPKGCPPRLRRHQRSPLRRHQRSPLRRHQRSQLPIGEPRLRRSSWRRRGTRGSCLRSQRRLR